MSVWRVLVTTTLEWDMKHYVGGLTPLPPSYETFCGEWSDTFIWVDAPTPADAWRNVLRKVNIIREPSWVDAVRGEGGLLWVATVPRRLRGKP